MEHEPQILGTEARSRRLEAARPGYEEWLHGQYLPHWGQDRAAVPPSLEDWLEGVRTPTIRPPRIFDGRLGQENQYTLATWRACNPPNQEAAIEGGKMVLAGAVRTLWLHSPGPGTTKTGLAISLAKRFCDDFKGHAVILRMPALGAGDPKEHAALLTAVKRYRFVILDDAHRYRYGTAGMADLFHSIADILLANRARVVVTANATHGGVLAGAGPELAASFDRYRDGGLHEVDMTGDSRRG